MQDLLSLATETTLTIISCLNPLIRLQPVRHEIAQKYGITQCFLVLYLLLLAPSAVGTIPSWTYRYRSRRPRTDLEAHLRRVQVPKFYKVSQALRLCVGISRRRSLPQRLPLSAYQIMPNVKTSSYNGCRRRNNS